MWPRQHYFWAVALAAAGTRAQTPESVDVIVVGGGASGKQFSFARGSVSSIITSRVKGPEMLGQEQ